jgi:hypothetical protein
MNVQLPSSLLGHKTWKYPSEFNSFQEGCQPHMSAWHKLLDFMICSSTAIPFHYCGPFSDFNMHSKMDACNSPPDNFHAKSTYFVARLVG